MKSSSESWDRKSFICNSRVAMSMRDPLRCQLSRLESIIIRRPGKSAGSPFNATP